VSDFLDYVEWFTNRTKQWGRFLEMLAGQTEMAVMLIEAPTLMGKTFLIKRMAHHCEQERFAHVYIDFAGPQVTSYLWLVRQVRDQLAPQVGEQFFNRLTQRINHYTDPRHAGKASGPRQSVYTLQLDLDDAPAPRLVRLDLVAFRDKLIESFSHAEMRELAFALGLHHDDIEGETRSTYALGLITRCERDDLLVRLLAAVSQERPDETWCVELSEEERIAWEAQQESGQAAGDEQAGTDGSVTPDLGFETLPADEVVLREAKAVIDRALQECLSNVSEDRRIAFLFDSYERGNNESQTWLNDSLLMPIINRKLTNSLLILAGQKVPEVGDRKPIVGQTGLDLFSEEHVREYIEEKRKIEPKIDFFQASQGNPYILATVVSNMTIPTAADDSW
jgi:hypothetical protein